MKISGLAETQRMILDVAGDVQDALPEAMKAASSIVEKALREDAPRGDRSGGESKFPPLEASVITDVSITKNLAVASTGFGEAGPVALWNERGHRIVGHTRKDTGKRTVPNPFMARSTLRCADQAVNAFVDSMTRNLERKK